MTYSKIDLNPFNNSIDSLFEVMFNTTTHQGKNFPPYNIVQNKDVAEIIFPVHGRTKKDVSVTLEKHILRVQVSGVERNEKYQVIHSGLAMRGYKQSFKLNNNVNVIFANVENGLLTIRLELKTPKEDEAISIDVT